MFNQLETKPNRRWTFAHTVSLVMHCAVIYVLVRQSAPIFVQPTSLMSGFGGKSMAVVYLPSDVALGEHTAAAPHKAVTLPTPPKKKTITAPPPVVTPPKAEG